MAKGLFQPPLDFTMMKAFRNLFYAVQVFDLIFLKSFYATHALCLSVVSISDKVFTKIDVSNLPENMVVQLKSCLASPNNDKTGENNFVLFNGDEVSSEVNVEVGINCQAPAATFSFDAFAFKQMNGLFANLSFSPLK